MPLVEFLHLVALEIIFTATKSQAEIDLDITTKEETLEYARKRLAHAALYHNKVHVLHGTTYVFTTVGGSVESHFVREARLLS